MGQDAVDDNLLIAEAEELLDSTTTEDDKQVDSLLQKLLDIEDPIVSMGSVDFLTSEGICEKLVDTISMLGWDKDRPRLTSADGPCAELISAFRATSLLTCGENGYSFGVFMDKCATNIATRILHLFSDNSGGSFYHAEEIIIHLLKTRPSVVHNALTEGGIDQFGLRMQRIIRFIGHEPVSNLTRILFTEPALQPNMNIPDHMASFLSCLSAWGVVKHLAQLICEPEKYCVITENMGVYDHVAAAVETLMILMDRLGVNDPSDILSGLGDSRDLLEKLIKIAVDTAQSDRLRLMCLQFYCDILRGSAFYMHVVYVTEDVNKAPVQKYLENRLHHNHAFFAEVACSQIGSILSYLLEEGNNDELVVKHPGGYAVKPFGALRIQMLIFLASIVEASPEVADQLVAVHWARLVEWIEQYPHSDMYHVLFYRLFFAIIRRGSDAALDSLFAPPVKVADWLQDIYVPHSEYVAARLKGVKHCHAAEQRRLRLRGFCMNCCNALRLQLSALSPDSHLATVVCGPGSKWADFVRPFVQDTWEQQMPGASAHSSRSVSSVRPSIQDHPEDPAGLQFLVDLVRNTRGMSAGSNVDSSAVAAGLASLVDSGDEQSSSPTHFTVPASIDFGSALAKGLGFTEEDTTWNETESARRSSRLASFDNDNEEMSDELNVY